jgi:hypothetical protein
MRIHHVAQAAKNWPDDMLAACEEKVRLADTVEHETVENVGENKSSRSP